jgi:TonB-dependent receptor
MAFKTRRFKFWLCSGVSALAALHGGASAQDADAAATSPAAEEVTDEVVVRGIRRSLERAIETKRNADQIIDGIDAEDIGKLPDTNVAEALQRITGVQINRELGEGSELTVRGFSQNRVEINGQTQVGSGSGGGVTFQTVPSEAFSSLQVVKTPTASDVDGAIGAIVRLNTRKPLDLKKPLIAGSASGQYADRASAWAPNANIAIGNSWNTEKFGQFGAIVNWTHTERKLRQDFLDVRGWEAVNFFYPGSTLLDLDADGVAGEPIEIASNGIISNLQDGAFVPLQTRFQVREQDRDLDSFTVSLQWRPTERLEFYVDGVRTTSSNNDSQFQYTASLNSALQVDAVNGGMRIRPVYRLPQDAVITENQTVLSSFLGQLSATGVPQRGVNFNISGNSAPSDREVITGAFGVKFELTDETSLEARYSVGHGNQINDQIFTSSGVVQADDPFLFFDFGAGTDLPTIIPVQRTTNGLGSTAVTPENRIDLAAIASYNLEGATFQPQFESNNERSFDLDFDHQLEWGGFTSVEFGMRLMHRDGKRKRFRADDDDDNPANGGISGYTFAELDTLYPGLIVTQPYDDLFNGASGDFPASWLTIDSNFLTDNAGQIRTDNNIVPVRDSGWGFIVDQSTQAGYVKGNFEGVLPLINRPFSGNVGLRYVRTQQTALGALENGAGIEPFLGRKTYDNWLPSGNIAIILDDDFFLRFGVARAIARPEINDVAPIQRVQFFALAGDGGNPDLDPERVSQFDVSLEKYFGDASLFSLAYFYKDFSQRIEDGVIQRCFNLPAGDVDSTPGDDGCLVGQELIRLNVPANVGSATVQGIEVGVVQTFDFLPGLLSGFGVQANYTYVDASGGGSRSATGLLLPVQDLSKHAYNVIGFYESGGLSVRGAYGWRSSFYDERTSTNQAAFAEPYGQLDVSASYDLNKRLTFTFEGLNILNAPELRYQELRERLTAFRVNDTRYVFGVRLRY